MPNSTKNNPPSRPTFRRMLIFSGRLLLGIRFYAMAALLVLLLLSGHLSMLQSIQQHDESKLNEARYIQEVSKAILDNREVKESSADTEKEDDTALLEFWGKMQLESTTLIQGYSTMQRYKTERPAHFDQTWPNLYESITTALRTEVIKAEDDIVLKAGLIPLLENHLYNSAAKAINLPSKELRPSYDRAQYWRNLYSGTHYISFVPILFLVLLLHNSFSIDFESQTNKLLESLPLAFPARNFARLLSQVCLCMLAVWACIVLCALTYPAPSDDGLYYLYQQGNLSAGEAYLHEFPQAADYLIAAPHYFLAAAPLYCSVLLFWALLSMAASSLFRSSVPALLISLSILLLVGMPNFAQGSLMHLLPTSTGMFSVQMIIEGKAALSDRSMLILCNFLNALFCIAIVYIDALRRK